MNLGAEGNFSCSEGKNDCVDCSVVPEPVNRRIAQAPDLEPRSWASVTAALALIDTGAVASDIAERVVAEVPYLSDDEVVAPDVVVEQCRIHLHLLGVMTTLDDSAAGFLQRTGAKLQRLGIPLAALSAAYDVACTHFSRHLLETAVRMQAQPPADVARIALEMWALHDALLKASERGWEQAHRLQLAERDEERSALLRAVLSGTVGPSARLREVVEALGLPWSAPHIVVTITATGAQFVPNVGRQLRKRGIVSVWLVESDVVVALIAANASGLQEEVLHVLDSIGTITAGISPARARYAEAELSYRLALAAAGRRGQVSVFGSVTASDTVATAPDIARETARVVLGDLLAVGEPTRRLLLETLRAWFVAGGSTALAARALFLHPNTVRNRLNKVQSLTNRSLTSPSDICALAIAIESCNQSEPDGVTRLGSTAENIA